MYNLYIIVNKLIYDIYIYIYIYILLLLVFVPPVTVGSII